MQRDVIFIDMRHSRGRNHDDLKWHVCMYNIDGNDVTVNSNNYSTTLYYCNITTTRGKWGKSPPPPLGAAPPDFYHCYYSVYYFSRGNIHYSTSGISSDSEASIGGGGQSPMKILGGCRFVPPPPHNFDNLKTLWCNARISLKSTVNHYKSNKTIKNTPKHTQFPRCLLRLCTRSAPKKFPYSCPHYY